MTRKSDERAEARGSGAREREPAPERHAGLLGLGASPLRLAGATGLLDRRRSRCRRRRRRSRRRPRGAACPRPPPRAAPRRSRRQPLASATSNSTAVMLSSPPRSFAALISARVAARRSWRFCATMRGDRLGVDHRREPVGAEQEEVARSRLDREHVDVDVRVGAERTRDHGALRVHLGLFGRQLAAPHELGDERVVVGELLERIRRAGGRRASRRRGRS